MPADPVPTAPLRPASRPPGGRRVPRALLAALLVAGAACDVEFRKGSSMVGEGSAGVSATAAPAAAVADSAVLPGVATNGGATNGGMPVDPLAVDTATRRGPAMDTLSGHVTDEVGGEVERTGPIDSTIVAATPNELTALGATLAIPVSGIRAGDLVDSFDDTRDGTRRHDALDILAPRGTPVVAATDGRVVKLFDSKAGGLMIYTSDASERFILMYGHLDRYADGVTEGMAVRRGQLIGYVGSTGNASPEVPHLHFAIARTADPRRWWGGTPVNPYPLLKR